MTRTRQFGKVTRTLQGKVNLPFSIYIWCAGLQYLITVHMCQENKACIILLYLQETRQLNLDFFSIYAKQRYLHTCKLSVYSIPIPTYGQGNPYCTCIHICKVNQNLLKYTLPRPANLQDRPRKSNHRWFCARQCCGPYNFYPDLKKFVTDPDPHRTLIMFRIQAKMKRNRIQTKKDSVPGKSNFFY